MKKLIKLFPILFLIFLYSCQNANKITTLPKRDKPLIDTKAVIKEGLKDMNKKIEDGPKPKKIEITKEKRKTITTQKYKNYVTFPAGYRNLKQKISINFQHLELKYAMGIRAEMGNINKVVRDDITGKKNAKINQRIRMAVHEDINWPLIFVISDNSSYVNGQTLVVDGGRVIWWTNW